MVEQYFKTAHLTGYCTKLVLSQVLSLYVVGINAIWNDVHEALLMLNGELNSITFQKKEYNL